LLFVEAQGTGPFGRAAAARSKGWLARTFEDVLLDPLETPCIPCALAGSTPRTTASDGAVSILKKARTIKRNQTKRRKHVGLGRRQTTASVPFLTPMNLSSAADYPHIIQCTSGQRLCSFIDLSGLVSASPRLASDQDATANASLERGGPKRRAPLLSCGVRTRERPH